MDGRGRWMDNIFIEPLWRSLKYEEVYLEPYADGREAKAGIGVWIAFYNTLRPHQALGNRMPMAVRTKGATTGDIPLRMGDASASPTCPQPHLPPHAA